MIKIKNNRIAVECDLYRVFLGEEMEVLRTYLTKKAFEDAKIVMERSDIEFTEQDAAILEHVFEKTKKFRRD